MKKYIRFYTAENKTVQFGMIENDTVTALAKAPWDDIIKTDDKYELASIRQISPVAPSKIICVGLNYHAHVAASYSADEAPENPLLFLKPSSAIIGSGENIIHPKQSERVDYEAELGVVIGKTAKNVSEKNADEYIFGFTCVNDVTARDLQKKDGQWSRAKGFDTFCPTGPHIVQNIDYADILIEGIVNGETIQSGRTAQMIFKIPFLIEYISSVMTLYPGDLISTGTPAKIAPMHSGDEIEVRIENVGSLKNKMS